MALIFPFCLNEEGGDEELNATVTTLPSSLPSSPCLCLSLYPLSLNLCIASKQQSHTKRGYEVREGMRKGGRDLDKLGKSRVSLSMQG